MFRLKKFLFCYNLKKSALLIGWIAFVFSILSLIFWTYLVAVNFNLTLRTLGIREFNTKFEIYDSTAHVENDEGC